MFTNEQRFRLSGYLIILLSALLMAACQPSTAGIEVEPAEQSPSSNQSESSPSVPTPELSDVQVLIPANDLAVGRPRVPFLLRRGAADIENAVSVEVSAFDLSQSPPAVIWQGPATSYSDYAVPYWVFYPEIEADAGNYGFQAAITFDDQSEAVAQFAVALAENEISPGVGDDALLSQNRILADGFDVEELTSDVSPDPILYEKSIAEIVANGQPSVISFSTPAFCQTAICAPVLDAVKRVESAYGEQADFVHIEIYKTFDTLEVSDTVTEWRLQSEPWTYVVDGNGVIQSRLGGPVSEAELTERLDQVIAAQ